MARLPKREPRSLDEWLISLKEMVEDLLQRVEALEAKESPRAKGTNA